MTRPTGRPLIDLSMAVDQLDEHELRVAMGYLIGASTRSVAVRRALNGSIDAAHTYRSQRADQAQAELAAAVRAATEERGASEITR